MKQVAALPYRLDAEGQVEVMLITSLSDREHWLPPKGHLIDGLEPHQAAAQEAFEEAGVIGQICAAPLGEYRGAKRGPEGAPEPLEITLFPMRFVRRPASWPEKGQRATLWFEPEDAAKAVREPELARILREFKPF